MIGTPNPATPVDAVLPGATRPLAPAAHLDAVGRFDQPGHGPADRALRLSRRLKGRTVPEEEHTDYRNLVKRLQLPPGHAPPRELSYDEIRAYALTRADVHDDTAGINASIDVIRQSAVDG
jgi:hypothetical protein